MLDNMKPSKRVTNVEYYLDYEWNDCEGAGFHFSCDEYGNVGDLSDAALENYENCVNGSYDVTFHGVAKNEWTYREPGSGTCRCGRTVYLEYDYGHGIDCECGRIYNLSGQELRPRSQWEDYYDDGSTQPYNVEFGYAGMEDY